MTRQEDIWNCSECGTEQGRHDQWFDGICEECNTKKNEVMLLDKNGVEIYVGVDVEVPSPTSEDDWNFDFQGVVIKLDRDNGYAVVEDGDGNCWCVEFERLEIL